MKKLLFILVLIILTLSSCVCVKYVDAQDDESWRYQEGDLFLTGKAKYNTSKQGDNKESELKFSPSVGLLLTKKVEVGLNAGISTIKNEFGTFEDKQTSYSVAPYLRYYPCPELRLLPYLQAHAGYTSTDFKPASTDNYKQSGFDAGASLGLNYSFNDKFAVEFEYAGINYQSLNDNRDGIPDSTSLNAGLNFNRFSLGARLRF